MKKSGAGRPTDYTKAFGEKICAEIAVSSCGIRKLCDLHEWFPSYKTIMRWRSSNPEFRHRYMQAKVDQLEIMMNEIAELSDENNNDTMVKINRHRLQIDTRKWIAGKLAPRLYGDKLMADVETTIRPEEALKELA